MLWLDVVLEAKYGEDAILEAFTPAYWQSARSMFSKDEHGNYVSRQDHLQGKGTAALKALDTQDDGAMEIKIGSYEDVVVDRADIPAPDLILNMEFLFAAQLTSAGLLQRTSVASAMDPSVGDTTKARHTGGIYPCRDLGHGAVSRYQSLIHGPLPVRRHQGLFYEPHCRRNSSISHGPVSSLTQPAPIPIGPRPCRARTLERNILLHRF
jgi:hypothetical protein